MKYAVFVCIIFWNTIASATTTFDTANSSDHNLLSRYPGFFISGYSYKEYDQASIITGPYNIEKRQASLKTLEGKVTNILYDHSSTKPKESFLQLYRNYEQALLKLNAQDIYKCKGTDCLHSKNPLNNFSMADLGGWLRSTKSTLKGIGGQRVITGSESGLLVASIKQKDSLTYVMITVSVSPNYSLIAMSFIEPDEVPLDKIAISSASEIDTAIKASGKAILDGILFDHNKSTIRKESKITLKAISDYLKSEPSKYYVVGHTDITGDYNYNLNLSTQRAKAIISYLKNQHGINEEKLIPIGVGPVSPVTNNISEEGKAKNRRVELVRASYSHKQSNSNRNFEGTYAVDLSKISDSNVKAMAPTLPKFQIQSQNKVRILINGNTAMAGTYNINKTNSNMVSFDFGEKVIEALFDKSYQSFTLSEGDKSVYLKESD